MGPRPSGRGNRRSAPSSPARGPRFNGASTFRSRKHRFGLRGHVAKCDMLQWGLDLPVEETRPAGTTRAHLDRASMGPRPSGRGNTLGSVRLSPHVRSFNGASTFRSRKHPSALPRFASRARLQWGLDLPVEETRHRAVASEVVAAASMGPRPSGRGNFPISCSMPCALKLQWGLDLRVLSAGVLDLLT